MATEIRILDQARAPAVDPQRAGKEDLIVTYSVNGTRGYLLRLPAEGATPATIEHAIKRDVAERGAVVGRTFSV